MRMKRLRPVWIFIVGFSFFFSFCTKHNHDVNHKTRVLAILGSSTAEGVGATPRDSSWANKIKFQLQKDGVDSWEINLALSGFRTFDVLPSSYSTADTTRNVDKALRFRPDLIIINLPSNDFAYGSSDAEILNNFKIITRKIDSAGIPFILMSTQPRNFSSFDMRERLALFNNILRTNFTYHFLNVYPYLATADYYQKPEVGFGDGVHLNNLGHNILYTKILNDSLFRKLFY
jgi:lysophospholipase L1-like esterase